jgi:phosphopantetheine--protein transferase-like protein
MEIGVDCIEIKRFIQFEKDSYFLSRIFTQSEIKYCQGNINPCQHYAARFAGKESVIKAMSHYGVQLLPNQIEILNNEAGIPYVTINAENCGRYMVKISLSHSDEIALAFVIVEKIT